jgi:hypothetical protein
VSSWYAKVIRDATDLSPVLDACDFFDKEYTAAMLEVDITQLRGKRVEEIEKELPGIVGRRYYQLQEIEAILGYLNIRQRAIKGLRRRHYLEHYNRALAPPTAEKYVEADDDVLAIATLINQLEFVRNKFEALSKQHEYLHFQLTNITKLLAAGVNDTIY